ncbi:dihydropteroate synthase [Candidatus Gracilibacteria bacterium]|nr:dihydropteroate synthase [Candidatus Gracilibacteria bacterium]
MNKIIKLFGILNVTPDSFSDGGEFINPVKAIEQVKKLFEDGADFIDVGGQSTRPGANEITPEEEWGRVEPVLQEIISDQISLDTKHPDTAQKFLDLGGRVLNDVSGFQNQRMREMAPQFAMIIINHFPGETVEEVHEQKICSINQVKDELLARKEELIKSGVDSDNIVLDPGIGFGKTMELNRELLRFAELVPQEKIMIGYSRKRFLGEHRLEIEPNLDAAKVAINAGTKFLRIHDVREHKNLI